MFKKILVLLFLVSFVNFAVCPMGIAKNVILPGGVKVDLKLAEPVSSKTANAGDEVNFLVANDVRVGDDVLIKEGARATGTLMDITRKGRIGKPGKLVINIDKVQAVDGKKIPLAGNIIKEGESKKVASICLCLISLYFLMLRGTDAELAENYPVKAKIEQDVTLALNDATVIPVKNLTPALVPAAQK